MVAEGLELDDAQGSPLGVLDMPGAQVAPDEDLDFLLEELLDPGDVAEVSSLELVALLALEDGCVVLLGGVVAVGAGGVVLGAAPGEVGADGLVGAAPGALGAWANAAPAKRRPALRAPARRWPDRSMKHSCIAEGMLSYRVDGRKGSHGKAIFFQIVIAQLPGR